MSNVQHEAERLQLLRSLEVLDTPPEQVFDRITRVLASTLGVPIALVSLVDEHRQWFKSRVGLDVQETPRDAAFCAHAIGGSGTLVVEDARTDVRFRDNPLVVGAPHIRFYAGTPIRTREGFALGTLCAIDDRPRQLTDEQRRVLEDLGALVAREFHLREAALDSRRLAREAEGRFEMLFERVGSGLAVVSPEGRWLQVNQALVELLGYSREELAGMSFADVTVPEDLDADLAQVERLIRGEIDRYELEKRYVRKGGSHVWVNITVTKQLDRRGALEHFLAVINDIDARKHTETRLAELQRTLEQRVHERTQALAEREMELRAVLEHTQDAYVAIDSEGRISAWNRAAEALFGWTRDEAIGQAMHDLLIPEPMRQAHLDGLRHYLRTGEHQVLGRRIELDALHKDGRLMPLEVHIDALHTEGKVLFNAFLHEISQRKEREDRLRREALQDPLTGLPNRRALYDHLPTLMERADRRGEAFALMFLDLDGFKQVNDALGHDAGDALLREVARRLRASLRSADQVYRLAGDEFTLLVHPLGDRPAVHAVAEKVLAAIRTPYQLEGRSAEVQVSIGVALFRPGDGRSHAQLIKDADTAMYQAKQQGRDRYRIASADQAWASGT
ncbi:PAS domain S-box protein [Pseudomonas otitidis]|uniref:PAS domain S-box protein n=1 Tax=Metapseudomonas otitidis TaxID=319939 RepID=A0ABU3XTG6_9GAMM|nr:PAS domain S-box protein [Pseudomonas otitidis]MDV3441225.1 PAS domain S-box protein [Pseudomonas otitidis]